MRDLSLRPAPAGAGLPPRLRRPPLIAFALWLAAAALVVSSLSGVGASFDAFAGGLPALARFLSSAIPPDLSRLGPILGTLTETFQMAVAGTAIGALLSVPLAVLAARRQSPAFIVTVMARALIAFFRTVPDIVWGLVFVIAVGLGPFAGTLAIAVDTIGFCGRFFAEAMEEADPGPQEALAALGAGRASILMSAVLPAAMPAMIATTLFALEKATRSSVVLGLVGAGGIGLELKIAMDFFNYAEASTIILSVFALVLVVEQLSSALRRRVIS